MTSTKNPGMGQHDKVTHTQGRKRESEDACDPQVKRRNESAHKTSGGQKTIRTNQHVTAREWGWSEKSVIWSKQFGDTEER